MLPGNYELWALVCYIQLTPLFSVRRFSHRSTHSELFNKRNNKPLKIKFCLMVAVCEKRKTNVTVMHIGSVRIK